MDFIHIHQLSFVENYLLILFVYIRVHPCPFDEKIQLLCSSMFALLPLWFFNYETKKRSS